MKQPIDDTAKKSNQTHVTEGFPGPKRGDEETAAKAAAASAWEKLENKKNI